MSNQKIQRLLQILRLRSEGHSVSVMQDDTLFFKVDDGEWEEMGSPEEVLRAILDSQALRFDQPSGTGGVLSWESV